MRKTWSILCVAALLALSLAGCAGDRTGGNHAASNPSAAPSATPSAVPSQEPHGTAARGDLAGEDGMVDGKGGADPAGTADNALERAGEGVRDTLDDLGDAARDVGRDARDMIEGR